MSNFLTRPVNVFEGKSGIDEAKQSLNHYLKGRGKAAISPDATNAIASMESDHDAHAAILQAPLMDATKELKTAMGLIVASAESDVAGVTPGADLTHQQEKAGLITMMAAGNPAAYAQAAYNVNVSAESGVEVVTTELNPGMDYMDVTVSQEAFDNIELENNLAYSVIFNTQAARQDEFAEAFFPTVVLTPDQNSLKVTIRRTMIGREVRHDQNGKVTDFNRRNLVDAAWDYKVTSDDTIAIVPLWKDNVDAKLCFAPGIAPATQTVNGQEVLTAPYAFEQPLNILGLSQNPALGAQGQADQTDSVDVKVNLKNVYFKLPGATPAEDEVIRFKTQDLDQSQFQAATLTEGQDLDVRLNFASSDFVLTGATLSHADAELAGLAILREQARQNYFVRIAVSVGGSLNLEKGNIRLHGPKPYVESVWELLADGTRQEVTDVSEVNAIKSALAGLEMVGYDLKANRTNSNRRNIGMLITSVAESVRYTVPIGSPITLQAPVTNTPSNLDLMGPITAARYRNSANAITRLLENADQLRALEPLLKGNDKKGPRPAIQGFARVMIQPYFHSEEIDLLHDAQGNRSFERAEDISATFINSIRDAMYRAYRDSGYEPNLIAYGGPNAPRPKIIIGTDPVLVRYLMVAGDTRTMSIGFQTEVVSTYDDRIRDKIYCTFVRNTAGQVDPLSYGVHAYIPELATSMPISRGSTTKETTIQLRTLHLVLCPILVEFRVRNVREAMAKQINVPIRYA